MSDAQFWTTFSGFIRALIALGLLGSIANDLARLVRLQAAANELLREIARFVTKGEGREVQLN